MSSTWMAMHCTMSGKSIDTTHCEPHCPATEYLQELRGAKHDSLSFPMVMFATIFFKTVFLRKKPLSRLSPDCRSSSRSSWALPLAEYGQYSLPAWRCRMPAY